MAKAWYEYSITLPHGGSEKGIDLGTPFHTPITALYAGTVRWAGRTAWASGGSSGGEVTIVCNVPGKGILTSYYLHLDTATVKAGDKVPEGAVIGLSGGQLSGGNWPVQNTRTTTFSTGPHTEFGFNAPWVSGPGSNIDPTFSILQARNGTLPKTTPDGGATVPIQPIGATGAAVNVDPVLTEQGILAFYTVSANTHRLITRPSGADGICEAIDAMESPAEWNWMNPFGSIAANFVSMSVRFTVALIGVLIMLFVVWEYIRTPVQVATRIATSIAVPESIPAQAALSEAPAAVAR